jgi:hypothetical protein
VVLELCHGKKNCPTNTLVENKNGGQTSSNEGKGVTSYKGHQTRAQGGGSTIAHILFLLEGSSLSKMGRGEGAMEVC